MQPLEPVEKFGKSLGTYVTTVNEEESSLGPPLKNGEIRIHPSTENEGPPGLVYMSRLVQCVVSKFLDVERGSTEGGQVRIKQVKEDAFCRVLSLWQHSTPTKGFMS
uniref:Uncharacterized protein n=1 Tax=Opuntia streptacantha TaxID=393608 RepID=A0A7C9EEP1_OPUST